MKEGLKPAMLLDRSVALERVGGDEELLREIAGLFLEEYPSLLEEIRVAIEKADGDALERSAHSLKGAVANFEADLAFQAASRLETLGRNKNLDRAPSGLAELEAVLRALQLELIILSSE